MLSCTVEREEHWKQISLACVGSACSIWTTLGLPQLTVVCVLPVFSAQSPGFSAWVLPKAGPAFHALCRSKLLRFKFLVLHKGTDSVGSVFCALPRSEQLSQPDGWSAHSPRCAVHLITNQVLAAQFPGCAVRAPSHVCHVSLLGS